MRGRIAVFTVSDLMSIDPYIKSRLHSLKKYKKLYVSFQIFGIPAVTCPCPRICYIGINRFIISGGLPAHGNGIRIPYGYVVICLIKFQISVRRLVRMQNTICHLKADSKMSFLSLCEMLFLWYHKEWILYTQAPCLLQTHLGMPSNLSQQKQIPCFAPHKTELQLTPQTASFLIIHTHIQTFSGFFYKIFLSKYEKTNHPYLNNWSFIFSFNLLHMALMRYDALFWLQP